MPGLEFRASWAGVIIIHLLNDGGSWSCLCFFHIDLQVQRLRGEFDAGEGPLSLKIK